MFKYTPRVNLVKTRKKEKKNIDKPISIERLSLSILAKSPKEVKKISKYFKQWALPKQIQAMENYMLKPRINMTTKGPSRKQVIVLMNNDNKMKFMEDSSNHFTNLNRALKNIKLEIIVNFI